MKFMCIDLEMKRISYKRCTQGLSDDEYCTDSQGDQGERGIRGLLGPPGMSGPPGPKVRN